MTQKAICELCGEPMPLGEEMFKYHGYSGPCPKPPIDPALLRDREEERLCTCGAAGTREGHTDWCDAAKEFNQPSPMTTPASSCTIPKAGATEICSKCGQKRRVNCEGNGWLEAIGPCTDGSYITSRPCPNDR